MAQLSGGSAANMAAAWAHLRQAQLSADERLILLIVAELAAPGCWEIDPRKLAALSGLSVQCAMVTLAGLAEAKIVEIDGATMRMAEVEP